MYFFQSFETKEDAKTFQKKNGGVLYDLDKERRKQERGKIPDALAVIHNVPNNYKYSVEWNAAGESEVAMSNKERFVLINISAIEVTEKKLQLHDYDVLAAIGAEYSNYTSTSEKIFDSYEDAKTALDAEKITVSDTVQSPVPFRTVNFWYIRKEIYNDEWDEWEMTEECEEEFAEIEQIK